MGLSQVDSSPWVGWGTALMTTGEPYSTDPFLPPHRWQGTIGVARRRLTPVTGCWKRRDSMTYDLTVAGDDDCDKEEDGRQ